MITGRHLVQAILLGFFLVPLGFFFYHLPQLAFTGDDFPEDMKMSLIISGIAIGMLWVIKDRRPPAHEVEEEGEETEEDQTEENENSKGE